MKLKQIKQSFKTCMVKLTKIQWLASIALLAASFFLLLQVPQEASMIRSSGLQANTIWSSSTKETNGVTVNEEFTVSVCTRLKNEAIYLEEWIEFHILAGVDHFHIFDDSSTDSTLSILKPYVDRGIVTLVTVVDHSHDADHGQFGHRDQCIAENPSKAKWIVMIDADEFIFPSEGMSIKEHIDNNCPKTLSFLMIRWHMFGSNGLYHRPNGLVTDHYRMHSGRDEACPRKQMGCFETRPPLSTKLIVNTNCVATMGTHYATALVPDAEARGCINVYDPLDSKETFLAPNAMGDVHASRKIHETCALPIHLNHYAVKSREDYLDKFQRGRISRGEKDLKEGLAYRNTTTGQVVLRKLPSAAVSMFLGDNNKGNPTPKLDEVEQRLLDIAMYEFEIRDFSEVRDESVVKYLPGLRKAVHGAGNAAENKHVEKTRYLLDPTLSAAPVLVSEMCDELKHYSLSPDEIITPDQTAGTYGLLPSAFTPIVHFHIPKTGGTNFNLQLVHIAYYIETKILNKISTAPNKQKSGEFQILKGEYCELSTTSAHHVLPREFLQTFGSSSSGVSGMKSLVSHVFPLTSSQGNNNLRSSTRASRVSSASSSQSFLGSFFPTEADTPAVQTQKEIKRNDALSKASWLTRHMFTSWFGFGKENAQEGCSILSGEMDASILSDMRKEIANHRGYNFIVGNSLSPGDRDSINAKLVPSSHQRTTLASHDSAHFNASQSHYESLYLSKRQLTDTSSKDSSVIVQPITMLREPIARTISQFEHHLSRDRFSKLRNDHHLMIKELTKLVSPSLCEQLGRQKRDPCKDLTNPLKCRANGWCGLFQNHISESLAGAMSYSDKKLQSLRKSSDQLLCAATKTLTQTLSFFGVMEHYDASICLLLHTFRVDGLFDDCCSQSTDASGECSLLSLKTTTNSNQDRQSSPKDSTIIDFSYQDEYLNNESLLAAMYDGNRIDCEVYSRAVEVFKDRLHWMEVERNIPIGTYSNLQETSQSTLCSRAAAAYHKLK